MDGKVVVDARHEGDAAEPALHSSSVCGICQRSFSKYTCPKCGIKYCGVPCYKSDAHADCSESFFKNELITSLKTKKVSNEERKAMVDILRRVEEATGEEAEVTDAMLFDAIRERGRDVTDTTRALNETAADRSDVALSGDEGGQIGEEALERVHRDVSGADGNVAELLSQFADMDLDDPGVLEAIWAKMGPAHRNAFEGQISTGVLAAQMELWRPWWLQLPDSLSSLTLIRDISLQYRTMAIVPECQRVAATLGEMIALAQLTPVSSILKGRSPSPAIIFNSLSVIMSYSICMRIYNGDCEPGSLAVDEIARDLVATCPVLSSAETNFLSVSEAVLYLTASIDASTQPLAVPASSSSVTPARISDLGESPTLASSTSAKKEPPVQKGSLPRLDTTGSLAPTIAVDSQAVKGGLDAASRICRHPCTALASILHAHIIVTDSLDHTKSLILNAKDQRSRDTSQGVTQAPSLANLAHGRRGSREQDTLANLKRAKKHLKFAQRKLWFLACWWNDIVEKVEDGRSLSNIKHTLESLVRELDSELAELNEAL